MTAIEVDQFLPRPPAQVWRALTDPVLLARWLMPNDFQPVIGHQFTFRTEPVPQHGFDGIVHCQVLDVQPNQLVRFSWRAASLDTTVSWRLVGEGSGTRLLISHDGFDDTDPVQRMTMDILGGGWRGHLVRKLGTLLDADLFGSPPGA
jgi:uncharacterized protein YndB with AHSA1/START domain